MTYLDLVKMKGRNAASDNCFTPNDAVAPLFPFLDEGLTYYEATSNDSFSIVDGLRDGGFKCEPSNGADFFDYDNRYDGIITNPPYSIKDKFLERCFELGKPFALLLPVTAFQGKKRGKMFNEYGISALVYNNRLNFTGGSGCHFGVAWFLGGGICELGRIWFVDN